VESIRRLEKLINDNIGELIIQRRFLHSIPELGYKEFKTTKSIIKFLKGKEIKVFNFHNTTGAYVDINNNCKDTIVIRVDIDALPIEENTNLEFESKHEGIMHACGHDVHITIGLGLSIICNELKEALPVNIIVVFQPAEECNPDGGAKKVIESGIFKNVNIIGILGCHNWPSYKVGEIGIKEGPIMSSSDKFEILIKGKNSHAAEPHKGNDAISASIEVMNMINIIRREIDPFVPTIISIGEINSRGRYNIICDQVEIKGTIRTVNEDIRNEIHEKIKNILEGTKLARDIDFSFILENGYNTVINDDELTNKFIKHSKFLLGEENVHTKINPSLIGEDFGFYREVAPILYFHLGGDSAYPLHSDKLIVDENAIGLAIKLISSFILNYN